MELLALTYSEFDNKVGPQLRYQYPLGIVSPEVFEELSEYVIVGKHLCEKCIAVRTDSFQFCNYSVAIDNKKYDRNALLFAVGVVLSLDANMDAYNALLRRFAQTLVALEVEREYLFQPRSKERLQSILCSAYEQLCRFELLSIVTNSCVPMYDINIIDFNLHCCISMKQIY
jgi:hypothetical protein